MKTCCLTILLNLCVLGMAFAQTRPLSRDYLDSLNTRIDSLTEKTTQRVERQHGAGAGVGADGPWNLEKQALQQSISCINQTPSTQAGVILGCLEPLRARYEQERSVRILNVTRLAHTLAQPLFLTKDAQLIEVTDFLEKNLPRIETDQNIQAELAHTLHWEQATDKLVQQFAQKMHTWKNHLQQDKTSN